MTVPVLAISGPVGSGKTTVAYEISLRLPAADVSHVVVDDEFALFFPRPPSDPDGENLRNQVLAATWAIYAGAGIERMILSRALADRAAVDAVRAAIPGADVRLFWLNARLVDLYERIDKKGVVSAREWCRNRAELLSASWRDAPADVTFVETSSRSPSDIAQEILDRSGWIEFQPS
ncbi:MAG: AAA family ATPase [Gaiellaceae bacterium]